MKVLQKIDPTEKLLQVHYYQFFNTMPFNLNNFYDININGLNEKYPGFLQTFDFTNIDVYDLHKFITIRTRLTHCYSDPIKYLYLEYLSPPQYFFCFWGKKYRRFIQYRRFRKISVIIY